MSTPRAYYNENDPAAAAWLRQLISAGLIPAGAVDTRSITDVRSDDLADYTQHHFFAGIGGWSLALRLAGWPDDRPVWTASCPCPPFSAAGKRQKCPQCQSGVLVWCPRRTGYAICAECAHAWLADARHLWPEVWRLAAVQRPQRIIGEQVASVGGVDWFAGVRGSLEILGYAVGAADVPAAGIGAPHIRQRLFWMADAMRSTSERRTGSVLGTPAAGRGAWEQDGRLADGFSDGGATGRLADADEPRLQGRIIGGNGTDQRLARPPGVGSPWRSVLILCADGKLRRVPADEEGQPESALFPLAHGVPGRVGLLRGAGNAICPQAAAAFVNAAMKSIPPGPALEGACGAQPPA